MLKLLVPSGQVVCLAFPIRRHPFESITSLAAFIKVVKRSKSVIQLAK